MSNFISLENPSKVLGVSNPTKVLGVEFISAVPAGLIVVMVSGSVPTGWTRFAAADDKFVIGAGNTKSPGDTGGSTTVSQSGDTDTQGSHAASVHALTKYYNGGGSARYRNASTMGGAHAHTVALTEFIPKKKNLILIKADDRYGELPANAGGLSSAALSGYSALTADGFLVGSSAVSDAAAAITGTVSSNGGHDHAPSTAGYYSAGDPQHATGGVHTHTLSISAVYDFNHIALRALYKAAPYIPDAGLIAMWEGATAPAGWALCDGDGGRPDLRDYFVLLQTAGDGATATGSSVDITVDLATTAWSHAHIGGASWGPGSANQYNGTGEASHGHTIAFNTVSYTPPYYALTFIQKG